MRLILPLVAVLLAACGLGQAPCTTSNCAGCCDQKTGACEAGTRATACGTGGKLCVACVGTETCASDFVCRVPSNTGPRCGASNCDGCCDSSGSCFIGKSLDACGAGGAACTACGGAQVCVALGVGSGGRCQ